MSDIAIRVENLSKLYRIGERKKHTAFRDVLSDALYIPFRLIRSAFNKNSSNNNNQKSKDNYIWALKNVSFEVKQGEVVGIIGRNGAGKSTLLKILSRITRPTEGRAEVYGRVGSLLEVGTGFHPELTGRENIYLNGAILGMKKKEIDKKFDEIVAFAEVEKFIDTPVKFYSSGMYVRLAFAVAAHLEPEILLVDEVLAVGDAAFQKKCLGKMGDVAKEGRTVLFVSHNMQAISTLTQRTILLDSGHILCDSDTYTALRRYREIWGSSSSTEYVNPRANTGLTRAHVITSLPNGIHRFGEPLVFEFEINFSEKPKSAAFSFQVVDDTMRPIVHLWLFDSEKQWSREGKVLLRCTIPKPRLYIGRYTLITHLSGSPFQKYETLEGICQFEVTMEGIYREYEWVQGTCTYLEDTLWEVIERDC